MLLSTTFTLRLFGGAALTAVAALCSSLAPPAQKGQEAEAPPGLVLIPGGRTVIGSDPKEVEKFLEDSPASRNLAGAYMSETPEHKLEVPDFYLMVNEVTNEQYNAFVRATGARPPQDWGVEAIDAASNEFLTEQGRLREEAKAAGEPVPPRKEFDRQQWWKDHWQECSYGIPEGEYRNPVQYVDHTDAQAYARWAGLRLMTEFEYQRAVRGDKDHLYPWGDKVSSTNAATSEATRGTHRVGSFPGGVSPQGVHDLIGNVWEWTSSKYVAYPKFKGKEFEFGKGNQKQKVSAFPRWDANARVCVSGSYHNDQDVARATTRRRVTREQAIEGLGFRCAASLQPGGDIAVTVMEEVLDENLRPSTVEGAVVYEPVGTLAVDRWHTDTPVGIVDASAKKELVEGYQVISGYDYVVFTPVDKIYSADINDLNKAIIEEGPVPIGFLATNQRILKPDLQPGSYMISYRCKGGRKFKPQEPEKEPQDANGAATREQDGPAPEEDAGPWDLNATEYEKELGLDPDKDYFLFFDTAANIVGAVEAEAFDKFAGKGSDIGTTYFWDKDFVRIEKNEDGDDVEVPVHEKWLTFESRIPGRVNRRGFTASIAIQVEDDILAGKPWRMPKQPR